MTEGARIPGRQRERLLEGRLRTRQVDEIAALARLSDERVTETVVGARIGSILTQQPLVVRDVVVRAAGLGDRRRWCEHDERGDCAHDATEMSAHRARP